MKYRWELLPRLASEVEFGRLVAARRDLAELLEVVAEQSQRDLTLCKLRCSATTSACVRGARRGGGPSSALMSEYVEYLRRLSRLRTWPAVKRATHQYVERLVACVQPAGRSRMARIVASIREDLRATLAEPKSLAQYAAELELSEGHLSRSFTQIAGRPFREELHRIRCEAAQELLLKTSEKIGAIAHKVGVRSASQFIADFSAQMGVTPGQFRRLALRKKN